MTDYNNFRIVFHAGKRGLQLLYGVVLRLINDDNCILEVGASDVGVGNAGNVPRALLLVDHAVCVEVSRRVDSAVDTRLVEAFKVNAALFCDGSRQPALLSVSTWRHNVDDFAESLVIHQHLCNASSNGGLAGAGLCITKDNINVGTPDRIRKDKLLIIKRHVIKRPRLNPQGYVQCFSSFYRDILSHAAFSFEIGMKKAGHQNGALLFSIQLYCITGLL